MNDYELKIKEAFAILKREIEELYVVSPDSPIIQESPMIQKFVIFAKRSCTKIYEFEGLLPPLRDLSFADIFVRAISTLKYVTEALQNPVLLESLYGNGENVKKYILDATNKMVEVLDSYSKRVGTEGGEFYKKWIPERGKELEEILEKNKE